MAKAVLVMDMPERCDMCDLRHTLPFGNKICYIKLKGVEKLQGEQLWERIIN